MKKLRIMMINPMASPKMPYDGPPLSILSAVAMVDSTVHQISVLDWHDKQFDQHIQEAARASDICGITCMTGFQISTMLKAAKLVKEANPNILLACGGCHPTLLPEQTLTHPLVDVVVIGQGQRTFSELVGAVAEGRGLESIPGLGFKRDGRMIFTAPRAREDLNLFPPIPYHLLPNFEEYLVKTSFAERTLYYLTSEGCTGNCKFCGEEALYHRRWRSLRVERIINDIVTLKEKYHFDGVTISDSNFYVNEKRVIEFCEMLKPLKLTWGGTSGRPDQLRKYQDSTFALMRESGLQDIFLGVESGSDDTLALMSKGATVQDTLEVLPRLHKYGIRVQCSFIIGVPGVDVEKDFRSTLQFINRLRKTGLVSQFHLFAYTPLPGTHFLPEAEKLGYRLPDSLEGWTQYEFHAHTAPWIPKKYVQFTDAASIYFMFLAGHARKVVAAVAPKRLLWPALLAERAMYQLSRFRIATGCFFLPLEYHAIKWVVMHKDRFFGDKKLMF